MMKSIEGNGMARASGWFGVAALLGALSAGCGGGGSPAMTGPDGAVFAACANDLRADVYAAGMDKTGKDQKLTVKLMSSDPGPPIKGTNAWTIAVTDAAGQPVDGATITVTPYMPDHNHGTSVKAVVTPLSGGSYAIAPLYFFMAGLWQTTLQVQSGDSSDSVVFAFCVAG